MGHSGDGGQSTPKHADLTKEMNGQRHMPTYGPEWDRLRTTPHHFLIQTVAIRLLVKRSLLPISLI